MLGDSFTLSTVERRRPPEKQHEAEEGDQNRHPKWRGQTPGPGAEEVGCFGTDL
jgi:hypothetical protein